MEERIKVLLGKYGVPKRIVDTLTIVVFSLIKSKGTDKLVTYFKSFNI